jgi:hypothetical protein
MNIDKQLMLLNLKEGDYIAFGFNYNGGIPKEIIVDNITKVYEDRVLVHFMYGYHSMAEFIDKKDIIAVGDNIFGTGKIKGWGGKFIILLENHPLLKTE